jgi:hypothetical protein
MKRILLLTMLAASFVQAQVGLAQKFAEPAEVPGIGAVPPAPSANAASRSRKATAPATVAGGGFAPGAVFFSTGSKGDSIPPVVIRFSPPDANVSAGLEEDLFVMARVISRTLERAEAKKVSYKMNVPMLLTGSGRSVRPMYIEGLGPLFMIKVNFPLMALPKAEEKKPTAPATESEWTEAQRDVFGADEAAWADDDADGGSTYNAGQVELLKTELIGALKNATNVRGLKDDESVNIAVFGHAAPMRAKAGYAKGGRTDAANADKGTVLTLRARKADIDAFAGGKLDAEGFKAKVTTTAYAGSGTGTTSINSWIQESTGRTRQ